MQCTHHPSSPITRRCIQCDALLCDHCVIEHPATDVKMCPDCRDMAVPYHQASNSSESGSFFTDLPGSLAYPIRDGGWVTLVAGGVFLMAINLISAYSCFGIIGAFLAIGYLLSYQMRIVSDSSDGNITLPDWPEFSHWTETIAAPILQSTVLMLLCFGPAIGLAVTENMQAAVVAGIVGVIYYPMAWIALSLERSLVAINPVRVFGAITKVPLQYVVAMIASGLVVLAGGYVAGALQTSIIGSALGTFVTLYFSFVSMHILGRLYYRNERALSWYGEAGRIH